jgi:arginine/lysine/ornithine decarboxylase
MADAVGARQAFFSTAGSSLSVKAAMLAVAGGRGELLIGRDAHNLPDPSSFEVEPVLTPRDAFFGPTRTVSITDAGGRVCAEQVTPYPPGIPPLIPGERISAELVD